MELKELYKQYRVAKLSFDAAKKNEEKYKKLLKEAMKEAGEDTHMDEDGYTFSRKESSRQSMDEALVLEALKERGLTQCIKTVEAVDEQAVAKAVEDGVFPVEELQKATKTTEIVTLTLTPPDKKKKGKAEE